jgi:hypothetical protein
MFFIISFHYFILFHYLLTSFFHSLCCLRWSNFCVKSISSKSTIEPFNLAAPNSLLVGGALGGERGEELRDGGGEKRERREKRRGERRRERRREREGGGGR